jgi:hypothetical protein
MSSALRGIIFGPPPCFGDLTNSMDCILLEKPSVAQLLKNIPILFEPEVSLPVHKMSPLSPILSKMQPIAANPVSLTLIVILSTYIRLVPPSDIFRSGFPTKILYELCLSPCVLHAPWFHQCNFIWRRVVYKLWSSSSLTPCHFPPSLSVSVLPASCSVTCSFCPSFVDRDEFSHPRRITDKSGDLYFNS